MELRRHLPFAVAAVPFLLLVWRFDWLCDDAFITFRYARNLAEGEGLVFNPGERVEGYSNFLWTVWLSLFERLGLDVTVAARASSAACGVGVLWILARLFTRRMELRAGAVLSALLFPATLPPLAAWSTGGLAALPQAFFLLLAVERLLGDPQRPHGVQAGLAAAAAALVRADGPLLVALALGPTLAWSWRRRELRRAVLTAVGLSIGAVAVHLVWRSGYYGELAPNTARVKVDPGAVTFERGAKYVATFFASYPAAAVAAALAAVGARRGGALTATAWTVLLGTMGYAVFVGGDFMAMGRFLVPALPFLALLLGWALRGRGAALGLGIGVLLVGLSALSAFDLHPVPRRARETLFFRWSADEYRTEHEQWEMMSGQAKRWAALGRALARHTSPEESLIHGTIGAVGYHSRLVLHDPFGLVNRHAFREREGEPVRRSPGHHRRVPLATFMALHPTYLDAELVPRDRPDLAWPRWLSPEAEFGGAGEGRVYAVEGVEGVPEGYVLRVIRNVGR